MSGNERIITLDNGNKITVYPSSLRGTMINSKNCSTEYEKVDKNNENSVYQLVPNNK